MNPRLSLKLAPQTQQAMTFALTQALEILQMPQQELAQWLLNEIEKNPLLELNSNSVKKRFDFDLPSTVTLYEHLLAQIRENFSDLKDQLLAEVILENLDERGFITTPLEEISPKPAEKVLAILQTFNPPGIFARNLQECLLIQLRAKGKEKSLSYQLVATCFDDLLHGRYTVIKKKLKLTDIADSIRELSRLSFRPAHAFRKEPVCSICPDIEINKVDGGWEFKLIEEELPQFHIQNEYMNLEVESKEERDSLRNFKTQAKWICRSLSRRKKLLHEICRILICKQSAYLEQKGALTTLSMKEIAEKLEVHESTISRALYGKYASTPRGIIALKSLTTVAPQTETAKEILQSLIQNEDKRKPLTDDELAEKLKSKGHLIARRTIAKYRSQLKIGSASVRKHS